MKKVLLILAFITLPLLTIAQADTNTVATEISIAKEGKENVDVKIARQESNATAKAQLLKINRRKSSDIISIKAYRKSLQIKVKEVKLC